MDKMTELETWRLIRGHACQFCGKKAARQQHSSTSEPWDAGPGPDGVRPIWPFRVRTCGRCLQLRLIKDAELLVSTYSALRPGLPFAILTQELNYIPSQLIQQKSPPPHLELIKYYFRPQLEELQSDFHDVKALGAATVAEWYKGLETLGQQSNADAARFEQWELQGGFSRMPTQLGQNENSAIASSRRVASQGDLMQAPDNIQQASVNSAVGTPSGDVTSGFSTPGVHEDTGHPSIQTPQWALPHFSAAPGQEPLGASGPLTHPGLPGQTLVHPPRQKTERSLKEAKETRAERRKEIERHCLALEPPIMPSTLAHMDAFQAAILISRPLDDKAWEVLRPRLLAQRADAEHRESKVALRDPNMQLQKRQQLEEEQRVAQANTNHMWFELKVPTRDKLQKYAQEFIHQTWSDGRAVTKATACKFAAEVLCHVRQRFDEVVAQEDRMLELKGTAFPQDTASLAFRKLRLEDMKWVYEEFVRRHTESFGRELFLCHVCDNQKLFAFEAVIQHFAAKHTNALSSGNSIVYWKADWPLEPPFDPHPNIPWALEATGNMPRTQLHQQAHSSFPPRGPPSSVDGGPRGSNTIPRPFPPPQWPVDPSQHINQNSYSGSVKMDSLNGGRLPLALDRGPIRDGVAGSSLGRSEASGYANEDGYGPRYHPQTLTRSGRSNIQSYQGSYTGGKAGDAVRDHTGRPAPRREEHAHPFEIGRGWEAWRGQGPMSHGSMIYSYGDGSSRFSYAESLQRDGGTSVEGISETGRGSKTTSRISLHRGIDSESIAPTSEIETSRDDTDQAATKGAVEKFLNSFSPMVDEERMDSTKSVAATAHAIDLQQSRSVPGSQSAGAYLQEHETWDRMNSHAVNRLSPASRQRPPLPVREIEQPPLWSDDPATQLRYRPLMPPDRDHEAVREAAHGGRYGEEISERTQQIHYDSQNEGMRNMAPTYALPSYEHQYFYGRDGRRYVEITEPSMERYPLRVENFPDRYHEPSEIGGSHYLENRRYFLERHVDHDNHVRAAPGEYRLGDDGYYSAHRRGPSMEYDGRYTHEEVTLEPRTRPSRISNREITYEPLEQPIRYTPPSFGAGRPGG
ncbi:uncharacterized protein A1O5_02577 [Cladophialophora psammophila CBS 110553]|uniref:Uncharacterized protein n=1 Tax=Cladophialophora psammophila CBS 110553 TaxID=1182543 RepID=W9XBH9_9EURO|nr:uncharacterized protein A1O5_02577 [Cladophialophora psammophila CBS 110553]EXJ74281.1 hypothetical protein A1O5_02577 [Cladophialophora psammophila CBS 110553]